MTTNVKLQQVLTKWNEIQPLSAKDTDRLSRKFTIDFNYNSNHIEGNTLTYGQTELLLLFGKVVQEAHIKDLEEMKAHNVGLKMMQVEASTTDKPLTETFIRQLHHMLLREDYEVLRSMPNGVSTSYTIHAGQYKTRPNSVITRYGDRFEYASPEETPALMNDLVSWYNAAEESGILSPIEMAALFHYRYIRIHPFEDGNGRIARLMVNFILSRHDFPMIVVRSNKKNEYLEALHKSDLIVGPVPSDGANAKINQIRPFVFYFEKLVADEISNNIEFISEQNEDLWWYNGSKVRFRSKNTGKILRAILYNPEISVRELTALIGINKSAIQKQLKMLEDKGYIMHPNGIRGQWHVSIVSSI